MFQSILQFGLSCEGNQQCVRLLKVEKDQERPSEKKREEQQVANICATVMNFLEFASDKYVALNIQHNFGGFFFNKVPVLRRLKWREVVSFKGLYGGLDRKNLPTNENGVLRFPVDADGRTVT